MASKKNPYAKSDPYGKASKGTQGVNDAIYKQGGGKNFFTDEASQVVEGFGGGAGIVEGVFTGNGRKIKEGIGRVANSVGSALSANGIRNALKGPDASYAGGGKDALAANRAQYDAGILAGGDQIGRGEAAALYGAGTAADAAGMGAGLYGTGMQLGDSGIGGQNAALDASIAASQRNVASLAEAQQRAANDELGRRMLGQAAAARGGNQAAAIRGAQQVGSQNALQTNQQLGLLRLQEDQAQRAAQIQAQQFAAGQYGQQAQLGYGTANQGAGQVNTAASTIGGIGGDIMNAGNATQGQFLQAEIEQNKAQLAADQATQEAKSKHKAGLLKGLTSGIASIYGGGG